LSADFSYNHPMVDGASPSAWASLTQLDKALSLATSSTTHEVTDGS